MTFETPSTSWPPTLEELVAEREQPHRGRCDLCGQAVERATWQLADRAVREHLERHHRVDFDWIGLPYTRTIVPVDLVGASRQGVVDELP